MRRFTGSPDRPLTRVVYPSICPPRASRPRDHRLVPRWRGCSWLLPAVAVSASAGVVSVGDAGGAFGGAVRSPAAGPFGDGATATSSSPPATAAAQRVE